jgi:hypothetical protein
MEDEEMAPKTTAHGGPSNADGDGVWDGTNSSTSTGPDPESTSSSEQPDPSPAPTTENPSSSPLTDPASTAPSTDGENETTSQSEDQPADPYDGWLNSDLEDELEDRGLAKTGNKAEMLARLREDDAAKAAADETGE